MDIGYWILEKLLDGVETVENAKLNIETAFDDAFDNIKNSVENFSDRVQETCISVKDSSNLLNVVSKNEALKIHSEKREQYNISHKAMTEACGNLYNQRKQAVELIISVEQIINSIANTPKEFSKKMGEVHQEINCFNETEKYAKKAYEASVKAGKNIAGGTAVGVGIASMAPTALMGIATTFGTASTGTAISVLSGAAAQKAAVAWLGRTFAGFAVKGGAGMAAGNAFLALAGPIGWGITATTVVVALFDLSKENKKISEQAIEEAKQMAMAKESLDEITKKVKMLKQKTWMLFYELNNSKAYLSKLRNVDFSNIEDRDKLFLGKIVNSTSALAMLLNESIE